jgi:hypothetical protein
VVGNPSNWPSTAFTASRHAKVAWLWPEEGRVWTASQVRKLEWPPPFFAARSVSPPPCEDNGDGDTGVIAGGGGKGAPLFSRPKPQSRGRRPGGVRIVRRRNLHPRNHSKSRRGANAEQPTGTETAEPSGDDVEHESEVTAVSSAGAASRYRPPFTKWPRVLEAQAGEAR